MAEAIFWTTLVTVCYAYLGYPALLWVWGRAQARPVRKAACCPSVSIVIAAHNEAAHIGRRIENCLKLDYPADRLEVIVVSDGSTDGTETVVANYANAGVRSVVLEERSGKAVALNHGVAQAQGDIIVFTDARQQFERGAIRELVANFHDPEVGAVSGELILMEPSDGRRCHVAGLYWRYEKWVRKAESRLDSVIGATGAIYAIRKRLFTPLPAGTILDDVVIPMRIILRGYRVVFEERALAWDVETAGVEQEFRRKVRTLAGNFQTLHMVPELWSPTRNRVLFEYLSHKVSRLLVPFALVGLLISSAVLAPSSPAYAIALVVQLAGYSLAGIGWYLRHTKLSTRVTSVPLTFVMLNAAALLGLLHFLRLRKGGRELDLWVKS